MNSIVAFGVILIALSLWILFVQRSLSGMDEKIKNAMEQIGVLIAAQWEVLTSLLDLTEWYATHGCETIIETMSARRAVTKYSSPEEVRKQENVIAETIREFKKAAEIYPDLKADPNYIKTMDVLHQYENTVQRSVMNYNNAAAKFDCAIRMLPTSIVASIMGFSRKLI